MLEKHKTHLLFSKISDSIIANNFVSLQGNSCYEYLLYGLENEERRNDGRLRDKWMNKYSHIYEGGWWCGGGIDLTTLNSSSLVNQCYALETEWGCFKPDKPRLINGKPVKYEHPPQVPTELFALKIDQKDWEKIGKNLGKEEEVEEELEAECFTGGYLPGIQFWQWVIDNPLPVIITEGAKKAASLLSAGYPAVALPGISTGWRSETQELIAPLKALCSTGREIIIAFDEDSRWLTRLDVFKATQKLGRLLENEGVYVSVISWRPEEGKGIDDFIAKNGESKLDEVFAIRESLAEYIEREGRTRKLDSTKLLEFLTSSLLIRF